MKSEDVKIQISTNLTNLLTMRRISLRGLSKEAGVPYTTLQEWTANRTPRNPVQVQKVASFLGVSMHYLLFGVEDASAAIKIDRCACISNIYS